MSSANLVFMFSCEIGDRADPSRDFKDMAKGSLGNSAPFKVCSSCASSKVSLSAGAAVVFIIGGICLGDACFDEDPLIGSTLMLFVADTFPPWIKV